eukprot:SAG22_NODE_433_length_10557_cov_6.586728_4_plen_443_part_00
MAGLLLTRTNNRCLQAWMREELKRRAWTRKKEGITYLQAYFHGEIGRRIAARRKLEYSVESKCKVGVAQRKLELLEAAVAEAAVIEYAFAGLAEAQGVMARLQDENEVQEMLNYALAARDGEEMAAAIKAADALGLEEIWSGLADGDPRKGLVPRCRMMTEQLSRYGELMAGLAAAMRERTVEALQAMIVECESVELECGEVQEAREMLKMAEFETNSRKLRQDKRQAQIEAKWAKKEAPALPPPNPAVLQDIKATERRITEFTAALSVAKENGEAFPGEIQRLEQKIEECERKLKSEAAKEEARKKQLEQDKVRPAGNTQHTTPALPPSFPPSFLVCKLAAGSVLLVCSSLRCLRALPRRPTACCPARPPSPRTDCPTDRLFPSFPSFPFIPFLSLPCRPSSSWPSARTPARPRSQSCWRRWSRRCGWCWRRTSRSRWSRW